MSATPLIPDTAPFTPEQRAWLNGFFAGIFSRGVVGGSQPSTLNSQPAAPLAPLTILFGSQTGTAEGLAKKAAKAAGKRNFAATVLDMASTDLSRLAQEQNVLVIVSTYGDGEPPDSAKALHAALAALSNADCRMPNESENQSAIGNRQSAIAADFSALRFSVCALGDSNYTQFCQCGKDFDAHLEKLGATRIAPRVDCDLDHEAAFTKWLDGALTTIADCRLPIAESQTNDTGNASQPSSGSSASESEIGNRQSPIGNEYGRSRPFPALLLTSRNLSARDSGKQVNHVEFSLEGSGLEYEAGDALGVLPQNCPDAIAEVLAALGFDGEEAVPAPDGTTTSLRHALTAHYDLGKPTQALLELAARHPQPTSNFKLQTSTSVSAPPHHVIDILTTDAFSKPTPAEFIKALRKLQPRLYSISSSPKAHPGQVHLTVGAVRYEKDGRPRKGVCSTFLADRALAGTNRVGVFVHTNRAFRPPADGATPMIMVGPGTGIAPFRAFLQERRAQRAPGRNWLFFGDQREATDFLYRDELLALKADGFLARLDLAWSRDQADKVYVQNRMLAAAVELFAWLEQGAHFYVCGDASRMAKDVDAALHTVVAQAGGKSPDQAAEYVQSLKSSKRYARDVY